MNRYIQLSNGTLTRAFTTAHGNWRVNVYKPSSIRFTISGTMDTVFSSIDVYEFEGIIIAAKSPSTYYGSSTVDGKTWGTPNDLMTILNHKGTITLVDHFGTSYTIFTNQYTYTANISNWDSNYALYYFESKLTGKKV